MKIKNACPSEEGQAFPAHVIFGEEKITHVNTQTRFTG
jgi:hypothetical protein